MIDLFSIHKKTKFIPEQDLIEFLQDKFDKAK